MNHEVYFVLDRAFDGDLWSLSRNAHVWIIKSTCNEHAARLVWDRETEDYSPLHGVTMFDGAQIASEDLYTLLGTIDAHHSEYDAPRPWDAIHVIGFPLASARRERIAQELGVEHLSVDPEGAGFAIRRLPNHSPERMRGA